MKLNTRSRILSWLLTICMVVSLITGMSLTASASDGTIDLNTPVGTGNENEYTFPNITVTGDMNVFSISVDSGSFKLTDATGFTYGVKSATTSDDIAQTDTAYTSVQYSGNNAANAIKSIKFTIAVGTTQNVTVSGINATLNSGDIYFGGHIYEVSDTAMTWEYAMEWSLGKNNSSYTNDGFTPNPIIVDSVNENQVLVNFYYNGGNTARRIWLSAVPKECSTDTSITYEGTEVTVTDAPVAVKAGSSLDGSDYRWMTDSESTLPNLSGDTMSSVYNNVALNNGGPMYLGYNGAYWDDFHSSGYGNNYWTGFSDGQYGLTEWTTNAEVKDTVAITLDKAIEAVITPIELGGDITGPITIPASYTGTIDLNGYSITGSDTGIINHGTLTVKDSNPGETNGIIGTRYGIKNYSVLTIDSGRVTGTMHEGIHNRHDTGYSYSTPSANVTINGGTIVGKYAAICDYADANSGVVGGRINGGTLVRTGNGNGYVITSYGSNACGTNWVIEDGVNMENTVPGKWVNATGADASPNRGPQVGLVDYEKKLFEDTTATTNNGKFTVATDTKDEGERITALTHINGDIHYSIEPETYNNIVSFDLLFYAGNSGTDTSDLKDIGFVKANYTDNNDSKQVGVTKIAPVSGNDWTPTDSTEVTFTGVMDLATLTAYNGMQLATSQLNSDYPYLWVRVRECNSVSSDDMDGTLYCIGKFNSWLEAARIEDTTAAKTDVLNLIDTLGDKLPTEGDLSETALTEKVNAVVIPSNVEDDNYALDNEKANAKLDVISLAAKLAAEINSNDKLSDDEKTALLNNVDDMLDDALAAIDSANDIDDVNLAIAKAQAKSAIIRAAANAHADINTTGGADETAVNNAFNTAYNDIDAADNANDIETAKNNGMADIFLKAYLTSASGNIYVSANSSNYRQIEAGEDDWGVLTDSEKAIVNAALKAANNNEDLTYDDLLKQAARYPISSGGGSSSSKKVIISSVKNGKITVDKPYASSGQTVTITVTPNTGYKLDTLTVTDKSGKEVEITDLGNGKYSFTMPSSRPATVKGTFVAIEDDNTDPDDNVDVDDKKCDGGEDCPSKHLIDVDTSKWYHEAIDYVVAGDLMVGITSNTFEPDSASSRAMIVTILYRLEGKPEASNAQVFDDVADGMWYTKAISWAAENDIVLGYGNGNYGPNDNVTREQLATILYRYANYKGYDISAEKDIDGFVDADKVGDWAYEALKWAYNKNIVQGIGNNTLSPNANAQRSEIAAMMMRFCENIAK